MKFTNTLIVENETGFLPESQREVYLSGAPLHVLAMELVESFRRHFGDRVPVSFSAGIDANNYAGAVALGLVPVTVCTDLLRPGGYGRLVNYHEKLADAMEKAGATTIDDYAIRAFGNGAAALELAEPDASSARLAACLAALESRANLREAAGETLHARWTSAARLLNTETYVRHVCADPRYAFARNARPPAHVDRHLVLFDCITCDKCIPVCPNDANFAFTTVSTRIPRLTLRGTPATPLFDREDDQILEKAHQIGTFVDFCNRCGNCDVFCPEEGEPYEIKPVFFGSEAHWRNSPARDGFFVTPGTVLGRMSGVEYRLDVEGPRVKFSGRGFEVELDLEDPEKTLIGHWSGEVPLTWCFIMDLLRRSVLDPGRVNYVNLKWSEEAISQRA